MSLINTASVHKEDFLYNFYRMCKDSIDKKEEGQPYAYIVPSNQHDYPTALKLLDILMFGGVEVYRATGDFLADGKLYPAGSFVVLMSQLYRPYAQALLENQVYPDLREKIGDEPIPPYDNAGWTLPLQMGVTCEPVEKPFTFAMEKLENVPYPPVNPLADNAPYVVLDCANNLSYSVVFSLLKDKAEVYRSVERIESEDFSASAGSFIIKNTPTVHKVLVPLLERHQLASHALEKVDLIQKRPLTASRVGLYQSWRASIDEGWTRYVFDDLEIPFATLHNEDFREIKKNKADLRKNFDIIVFADESPEIIKTGKPAPDSRWAAYFTENPPPYDGGIGEEGITALKNFVSEGGILVCMNNAGKLALKEFKMPAENFMEKVDRKKFFCPTSLLKVKIDNNTPIGYGMPEEAAVVFSESPVFSTRLPSGDWDRKVVANFPADHILMSGWLLGEEMIARKPAVVDFKFKKGHIVLIGFHCQHRAQSHGTYKFLLNSLLYPQ
jgi:hypothetical protein